MRCFEQTPILIKQRRNEEYILCREMMKAWMTLSLMY